MVRTEISPSTKLFNIQLHKGYVLTGTVIDDETGWPIPEAYVYAEAKVKNGSYGDGATAEFATDENGNFKFSSLDNRQYHLYLGDGRIVNENNENSDPRIYREFIIDPVQQKVVTLRIKLHEWSKLKPRKPD